MDPGFNEQKQWMTQRRSAKAWQKDSIWHFLVISYLSTHLSTYPSISRTMSNGRSLLLPNTFWWFLYTCFFGKVLPLPLTMSNQDDSILVSGHPKFNHCLLAAWEGNHPDMSIHTNKSIYKLKMLSINTKTYMLISNLSCWAGCWIFIW